MNFHSLFSNSSSPITKKRKPEEQQNPNEAPNKRLKRLSDSFESKLLNSTNNTEKRDTAYHTLIEGLSSISIHDDDDHIAKEIRNAAELIQKKFQNQSFEKEANQWAESIKLINQTIEALNKKNTLFPTLPLFPEVFEPTEYSYKTSQIIFVIGIATNTEALDKLFNSKGTPLKKYYACYLDVLKAYDCYLKQYQKYIASHFDTQSDLTNNFIQKTDQLIKQFFEKWDCITHKQKSKPFWIHDLADIVFLSKIMNTNSVDCLLANIAEENIDRVRSIAYLELYIVGSQFKEMRKEAKMSAKHTTSLKHSAAMSVLKKQVEEIYIETIFFLLEKNFEIKEYILKQQINTEDSKYTSTITHYLEDIENLLKNFTLQKESPASKAILQQALQDFNKTVFESKKSPNVSLEQLHSLHKNVVRSMKEQRNCQENLSKLKLFQKRYDEVAIKTTSLLEKASAQQNVDLQWLKTYRSHLHQANQSITTANNKNLERFSAKSKMVESRKALNSNLGDLYQKMGNCCKLLAQNTFDQVSNKTKEKVITNKLIDLNAKRIIEDFHQTLGKQQDPLFKHFEPLSISRVKQSDIQTQKEIDPLQEASYLAIDDDDILSNRSSSPNISL